MSEAIADKVRTATDGPREDGLKTAFLSAPMSIDTRPIRDILRQKGIDAFTPDQLDLPGQNFTQVLRESMERADLVVAVVDPTAASNLVFYDLGLAQATSKPVVVLLAGDVSPGPWASSGIPYFRFDPANPTGLEFGISQFLTAPHPAKRAPSPPPRRTHPLGDRAGELLGRLRAAGSDLTEAELGAVIVQAIRESGATALSEAIVGDGRVDLCVWSDDLSPWVGNPLPVELRRTVGSPSDLSASSMQLLRAISVGGMFWGLLIYGSSEIDVSRDFLAPNILHIPAEQFLESLRSVGFGDLVRRLRNERVHGGSRDAGLRSG